MSLIRPTALTLNNVSKKFGKIQALSNINFECKKGEIIILLGENGAGKSTLVSLLAGQIYPDEGQIFLNNQEISSKNSTCFRKDYQEKIGIVFQHSSLVSEFSVVENLLLNPFYQFSWKKSALAHALEKYKEIAQFLDISIDPHCLVKNLSMGEQQLIELIRSLWQKQELLIFDELTAHLTLHEVAHLEKSMKALAQKGYTILFITHKLEEALNFADKIFVLQKGKKTLELDKKDLTLPKHTLEEKLYNAMFSQKNLHTTSLTSLHKIRYDEAPFFEVKNISTLDGKTFSKDNILGLHNISFNLYQGEIFGIAGFDGQGQKYLAETLAGQRNITTGSILIDKEDITKAPLHKRQEQGIFYVSEDRLGEGIVQEESIGINLQLKNIKDTQYFTTSRILWKNIKIYAKKTMQKLSISKKHMSSPIFTLSGGNIQKIIISRELENTRARLVILHQPSYGVDLKMKKQLHEKFIQEAKNGKSFILISNDINELITLSHRIAIIKQGKLTDFFNNDATAYEQITKSLIKR